MDIIFQNDIKTDFNGYQKLISIIDRAKYSDDVEIVFDFQYVFFFEANLCAVLATIIEILEQQGKNVSFKNFNRAVETILRNNGFLMTYGYAPIHDRYDTAIKYQRFNPRVREDDNHFENYIQSQLLNKSDFPSHSKLLGKNITLRIFELYENARTHGLCNFIHACGQYFPKKEEKPLNITIVDTGRNFQENVNSFLKREVDAHEAIEWAMQQGNTTKTGDYPGGLGLDLIFQFIQHNKGKIQIISADGFWESHRGVTTKNNLNYYFPGTIANLRFNLNDDSHYSLSSEVNDLENIF